MARLIADKFKAWEAECEARFNQLKANEEELNRIFIEIYGLQDELTPEVEDRDVTVTVGSVEHPMLDVHYIMWILLETTQGYQKKDLLPGTKPVAHFALAEGETALAAYEYCNLHGLWKAELKA